MNIWICSLVWLAGCVYPSTANFFLNETTNASTAPNETQRPYDFLFELYTFPFTFLIGTISNGLTFMVMRRKKMRNQSTYFYMGVLAIADELVLIVGCLNFWVYVYTGKSVIFLNVSFTNQSKTKLRANPTKSDIFLKRFQVVACKVTCMLLYATLHFSVWVVVIMTIERYIAVALPLQASRLCTVKRAKISISILALLVLLVNFHFIITHALVGDGGAQEFMECKATAPLYSSFMNTVWPWIDLFIYASLPVSLIIIFNILILNNLFKATNSVRNFRQQSNNTVQTNSICSANTDQNKRRESHYRTSVLQGSSSCKLNPLRFWSKGPKSSSRKYLYSAKFSKSRAGSEEETCLNQACNNAEPNVSRHLQVRPSVQVNVQQNQPHANNNRKLTIMLVTVSSTFFITSKSNSEHLSFSINIFFIEIPFLQACQS
jgi:hypothetical protein